MCKFCVKSWKILFSILPTCIIIVNTIIIFMKSEQSLSQSSNIGLKDSFISNGITVTHYAFKPCNCQIDSCTMVGSDLSWTSFCSEANMQPWWFDATSSSVTKDTVFKMSLAVEEETNRSKSIWIANFVQKPVFEIGCRDFFKFALMLEEDPCVEATESLMMRIQYVAREGRVRANVWMKCSFLAEFMASVCPLPSKNEFFDFSLISFVAFWLQSFLTSEHGCATIWLWVRSASQEERRRTPAFALHGTRAAPSP